jgi:hypothetical protein
MSHDPLEALAGALHGPPPPDALSDVATAARRWEQLAAEDRELRFVLDGGRVAVEVRTREGRLVERLSPAAALAVAAGAPLPPEGAHSEE